MSDEKNVEVERPCYACLEESTHEIRVRSILFPGRWIWLHVCDKCEREESREQAANDAGVPARGEI